MGKIVKYELSKDKKGLLAFFNTGDFYHVHSNEMDDLQKWIHSLLLKGEREGGKNVTTRDWGNTFADGDEECDCDQFYRCPHCDKTFYINCPAHRDYFWFGAEPLELKSEVT